MPMPADHTAEHQLDAIVEALCQALRVWDAESFEHCRRTALYAEAIASELGLDAPVVELVRIGALLHDIGKMGVDLAVLKKPARLAEHEREHVALHPAMGASILERILPREVVECAAAHHEQPDGNGYPNGLRDGQIPLSAVICRVADVFDSLTTDQTYRPAMSVEEALAELRDGAGTRYAPHVVAALGRALEHETIRLAA
jgi:putative nucleotidyltransferase with HDIG domain